MPLAISRLLGGLWLKTADKAYQLNRGQGLVEYALILVLVAIVVIVVLGLLGNGIANNMYANIIAVL
jgi:Flp pilus assembly pilin Flp